MVVFGLCVVRFVNKQEKDHNKVSPSSSEFGNDIFDDNVFNGKSTSDIGIERRNPYKHQRFTDDD